MQDNGQAGTKRLAPTPYFDPDRRPTSNPDVNEFLSRRRTMAEPSLPIDQAKMSSLDDLEPTPIGPTTDIVLVEKMPLIDLAWVGDDSMLQCLKPLVSTSLRSKDSNIHWSRGIVSASYTADQRYPYAGTPSSLPPPLDGNIPLAQDTDISTRAAPNFNSTRASDSSSVEDRPLLESKYSSQSDESVQGYQSEQWNERYFELVEFHRDFGHCLVPYHYKTNVPLALWVARQRHQYNLKKSGLHSNMTDERQRALDALGFVWDSRKATWEERLNELKEFRNQKGHCNVPATYEENPKLASWVKCQRRQYRLFQNGQKSNMNQARITRLMEIGFSWDPRLQKKKKR